ncbi:MAG: hypothetical protein WBH09_02275 [Rugosibacter sp.]
MILRFITVLFLLSWFNGAYAADTAVPQFKAVVGRLERFFQSSPFLYDVQSYKESPTGLLIFGYRIGAGPLRFDVKKTDSLVTPILGTVSFDLSVMSSRKCGVVEVGSSPENPEKGAASMDEAQRFSEKQECWKSDKYIDGCSVSMTYGYSESKWELRAINSEPTGCAVLLDIASGRSMSGRQFAKENSAWKNLNFGLPNRR